MITYNINWKEFPHMTFAHTAILPYHAIDFPGNEKSIELSYIEKGRCELYIGGSRYTLPENGMLLLVKKNKISLRADAEHVHHTVNLYGDYETESGCGILLPLYFPITPRLEYLCMKLKEVITEFQLRDAAAQLKSTAMTLEILSEISRIYGSGAAGAAHLYSPSEYLLSTSMKRYVAENLNRRFTLAELAQELGKTPNYLNSVFKKVNGIPIRQYANQERIGAVRLLMQSYRLSLKEAGESVGITDQNYLSRLFKKVMGISAQKYFAEYKGETVTGLTSAAPLSPQRPAPLPRDPGSQSRPYDPPASHPD